MKRILLLSVLILLIGICTAKMTEVYKIHSKTSELMEEGYTESAARHIAKVELGVIPADKEYNALMED